MASRVDQACQWIARIDAGDMAAEEKRRLKKWLQLDAENRRVFRSVRSLWAEFDHLGEGLRSGSQRLPEELAALVDELQKSK